VELALGNSFFAFEVGNFTLQDVKNFLRHVLVFELPHWMLSTLPVKMMKFAAHFSQFINRVNTTSRFHKGKTKFAKRIFKHRSTEK
jgi:hypothetical protein